MEPKISQQLNLHILCDDSCETTTEFVFDGVSAVPKAELMQALREMCANKSATLLDIENDAAWVPVYTPLKVSYVEETTKTYTFE